MAHVRTQLREAIKTALTGMTRVGDRVYLGRHYPLKLSGGDLVSIHITGGENIRADTGDLDRYFDVEIELNTSGGADFEDVADETAVEIEQRMESDAGIRAIALDVWPANETFEIEEKGDTNIGRLTIQYIAHVVTERGNPTARQ